MYFFGAYELSFLIMKIKSQLGVSLIEVLVSVLLLTIGFLGLAGTQLLSAQNLSASHERTLAILYVENMADRIRSLQEGLVFTALNGLDNGSEITCDVNCTSTQLLQREFVEWNRQINNSSVDGGLPNGAGIVNYDEGDGTFEITVFWTDYSDVEENEIDQYSVRIRI